MIVIALAILGLALGWMRAGRAGGNRKDRVQWALAHMLAFMLVGLFATILIDRMA
ncbi:MAG TPA: hypothetical protein PKC09_13410 [Paracoccus sp. (in: a-proteobacteria)]|uniref:hypothetical protein n=1 Tax=uncultured Paracoccus sp. TaxID=189685 RepID=UPI00260C1DB0|nr:hypothetical protein [uncultured Paracoccus sp.]HMQ42258.1 hypothetical protein [Paracoccus sp. (in: a-proteobacteria)]HMR37633.1 hypothetical protein [Paracoccus sp. (in: a-proteobacteria)]